MTNLNGKLSDSPAIDPRNRGLFYGDALFETMHIHNGRILFEEDHWLRLMASMRIMRMEIPMNWSLEFFVDQVKKCLPDSDGHYSVRFTVWRDFGGKYMPTSNSVSFMAQAEPIQQSSLFPITNDRREVELFKDHYVSNGLLGTIKSNNKLVNILAGIFATENDYQDMLLINEKKEVVESIAGNFFIKHGDEISTPPLDSGCLRGVMRKNLIVLLKKRADVKFVEKAISPFDLQRADELFTTSVLSGVRSITKYRKKEFETQFAQDLQEELIEKFS